jgi:hypothetical protein
MRSSNRLGLCCKTMLQDYVEDFGIPRLLAGFAGFFNFQDDEWLGHTPIGPGGREGGNRTPRDSLIFPWYGRLQRRDGHPICARFAATGRSVVADELGKPECSTLAPTPARQAACCHADKPYRADPMGVGGLRAGLCTRTQRPVCIRKPWPSRARASFRYSVRWDGAEHEKGRDPAEPRP